jgi:hypothetical protein
MLKVDVNNFSIINEKNDILYFYHPNNECICDYIQELFIYKLEDYYEGYGDEFEEDFGDEIPSGFRKILNAVDDVFRNSNSCSLSNNEKLEILNSIVQNCKTSSDEYSLFKQYEWDFPEDGIIATVIEEFYNKKYDVDFFNNEYLNMDF